MALAVLAVAFAFSGPAKAEMLRIGVVSFDNASQMDDSEFSSGMADILVSELMQNRNIEIMERTQIDRVVAEIAGGMTGLFDESTVAKAGKSLGLNYVVMGKIIDVSSKASSGGITTRKLPGAGRLGGIGGGMGSAQANVTVNVKVVDVETGRLMLSEIATHSENVGGSIGGSIGDTRVRDGGDAQTSSFNFYSSIARQAISKAAYEIIMAFFPPEYEVLLVRPKDLVISGGRNDGVRLQQRYKVIREGEVLIDRNGNVVGVDIKDVADITITSVEATTATGKIDKIYKEPIVDNNGRSRNVDITINRGDIIRPTK